ncbi:hypothetical protein [Clostridium sp. LP20]
MKCLKAECRWNCNGWMCVKSIPKPGIYVFKDGKLVKGDCK